MKNLVVILIVFGNLCLLNSCHEKNKETKISENQEIKVKENDSVKSLSQIKPEDSAQNQTPKISEKPIEKSVKCEDKGGNMELGFTTECFWENYTFEETYLAFKEKYKNNDDGKFLEEKMPQANYKATFKEYPLFVDYKYSGKDELNIEILFPGGVTYITFKKMGKGVKTIAVHSPD